MRISDWSSDVCSSDLGLGKQDRRPAPVRRDHRRSCGRLRRSPGFRLHRSLLRIGRLSCTWRWKRTHATCPWGCARTRAAETVRPSEPLGRGLLRQARIPGRRAPDGRCRGRSEEHTSEEHTSELQSLMRISYAVFCLKKQKTYITNETTYSSTH